MGWLDRWRLKQDGSSMSDSSEEKQFEDQESTLMVFLLREDLFCSCVCGFRGGGDLCVYINGIVVVVVGC